jgi:hypothetical protein
MAHLLHGALSSAEDGLLLTLSAEPAADKRQHWLDAVKMQRKAVTEMTELLGQIRMQVEMGAAAVTKIFHTAAGYEELSEEQQKLLKKFTAEKEKQEKEKEEKMQKRQEQELLAQQIAMKTAAEQYKWPKGRGRGGYGNPYSYSGGEQHYYGQQTGMRQQFATGGPGGQQYGYADGGGFQQQYGQQMHAGQQTQQMPQLTRGTRPPSRTDAKCYGCGEYGHYARDKNCDDMKFAAYQAMLRQQVAIGTSGAQAASSAAQITYVDPNAAGSSGTGSG